MTDKHLTFDLLQGAARDELPDQERLLEFVRHLLAGPCPICEAAVAEFRREVARKELHARLPTAERADRDRDAERSQPEPLSDRRLHWIVQLTGGERVWWLGCQRHLHGERAALALLDAARAALPASARDALSYASCAEIALAKEDETPHLLALALAHQANALRALGALQAAEPLFERVWEVLDRQDPADMAAYAEISGLEGSLRKDQRRFSEAQQLLHRSARLFCLLAQPEKAAGSLLNLAVCHFYSGNYKKALATNWEAMKGLDPWTMPAAFLGARLNHAVLLVEGGNFDHAEDIIGYDDHLYESDGTEWMLLRRSWLEGRIAYGRAQYDEAEEILSEVRDRFDALGIGYDVALVSLDLALVYHAQGRLEDLKRLTATMVAAFQVHGLHQEAQAALLLLDDAARKEKVTLKLVHDLARFLEFSRADPSLKFRQAR